MSPWGRTTNTEPVCDRCGAVLRDGQSYSVIGGGALQTLCHACAGVARSDPATGIKWTDPLTDRARRRDLFAAAALAGAIAHYGYDRGESSRVWAWRQADAMLAADPEVTHGKRPQDD